MPLSSVATLLAVALSLLAAPLAAEAPPERPLRVGQEWSYQTRPRESSSTLIILKIEADRAAGRIVHISVRGLRLKNPRVKGGLSARVPHMPFAEDALRKSLVKLVRDSVTVPPFERAYSEWRRAYEGGKIGPFTVPIGEAVELMEKALNP